MSGRATVQHTIIASGDVVPATPLDVRGHQFSALVAPASLDTEIFVQGAWETTSASFARLQMTTGSIGTRDFSVSSQGGVTKAADLTAVARAATYIRPELVTAATDVRTFTLMTR